jgi:hypothetical protein
VCVCVCVCVCAFSLSLSLSLSTTLRKAHRARQAAPDLVHVLVAAEKEQFAHLCTRQEGRACRGRSVACAFVVALPCIRHHLT